MKGLSALCLLLTIGAIVNAVENQWMWDLSKQGGIYWLYDILFAVGFVLLGTFLWRVAGARAQRRLYGLYDKHARGEITSEEFKHELAGHARDFGESSLEEAVESAKQVRNERLWAGHANETYMAGRLGLLDEEGERQKERAVRSGKRSFATSLDLSGADTNDEDLAQLPEMPELEDLDLSKSLVTDTGLAHLAALKKLDFLDLSDTQITGEGLGALTGTPITRLDLTRATITDDGLASLAHLHTLEMLWLNETAITDDGLTRLVGLGSLEQLDISDTAVTDAGLEHLLALPSEFLVVYARRTAVTELSLKRSLEIEGRILHIESEQVEAETEAGMTQQRADYYFTQTAERFDELYTDERNPTAEGDLNEALRRMMIARECELDPSNPRSRGIWQLGSAGYIWRCAETVVRPRGKDEQISAVVEKSLDTDLDRAAALTLVGVACLKEGVLLGDGSPGGLIFGQQFLERGRIYVTESVTDDMSALSEEDILFAFYFGVALCDVEPLVDQLI